MRKTLLIIFIAIITAVGVAGDDDATIYDHITANPDYSLFALMLEADGGLADLLADPAAALTVFAPDDFGVTVILGTLGIPFETLLDDAETLSAVLRHHIIPAAYSDVILLRHDLTYVMTMLEERGLLIQVVDGELYLNATPVIGRPTRAANGFLFTIEQLLVPPERLFVPGDDYDVEIYDHLTIGQFGHGGLFALYGYMLEWTGLMDHLDRYSPFTAFAPSEFAFADYRQIYRDDRWQFEDDAVSMKILAAHIIPGHLEAGTIRAALPLMGGNEFRLLTLAGTTITFDFAGDVLTANGVPFVPEVEVITSNGVFFGLTAVLNVFD